MSKRRNPLPGVFNQPATLDQLPRDAANYYKQALSSPVYTYKATGRVDVIGSPVYERLFDGEPSGFVAVTPYKTYVRTVKNYAKRRITMGVPKLYRPVDPETGDYFGEAPRGPAPKAPPRKVNPTWRKGQYVRDEFGNKGVIEEVPTKGHRGAHYWVRFPDGRAFLKRSELRAWAPKAPKKNPGLLDALGVNRYNVYVYGPQGIIKSEGNLSRTDASTTAKRLVHAYQDAYGRVGATVQTGGKVVERIAPQRRANLGEGGLGRGGFLHSDTVAALRGSTRGSTLGSSGYRGVGSGAEEDYFARQEQLALERLRADRRYKNPKGASTWFAVKLMAPEHRKEGPFPSAAAAKRWLAEHRGERGPWSKLHRALRNDGQYTAYYVGDSWSVDSIGPEWAF